MSKNKQKRGNYAELKSHAVKPNSEEIMKKFYDMVDQKRAEENLQYKSKDQDLLAIEAQLQKQLTDAGLKLPVNNLLFPVSAYPYGEGRTGPREVTGISPDNKYFKMTQEIQRVIPSRENDTQCGSDQFKEHQKDIRVFAAGHELAHSIDLQLQLSDKILEQFDEAAYERIRSVSPEEEYPAKKLLRTNILERVADTAMTLYVESRSPKSLVTQVMRDYRQIIKDNIDHYTTTSIDLAKKYTQDNPSEKNLSIVDSTKKAAKIVSEQSGIIDDLLQAAKLSDFWSKNKGGYEKGNSPLPDALKIPEDIKNINNQQVAARDRLCVPKLGAP